MRRLLFSLVGGLGLLGCVTFYMAAPFGTSSRIAAMPLSLPAPVLAGQRPFGLMVLGTSLSAGGIWPADLAQQLETCLGVPVALQVTARGGATSDWGLEQLRTDVPNMMDLALVEFAANDSDLRRKVWPWVSAQIHREIAEALPTQRLILLNLNPIFGLRRGARPAYGAYLRSYRRLAREFPHIGFVDLRPQWQVALEDMSRAQAIPDGLHPRSEIAAQINVAPLLQEISRLYQHADCETGTL